MRKLEASFVVYDFVFIIMMLQPRTDFQAMSSQRFKLL